MRRLLFCAIFLLFSSLTCFPQQREIPQFNIIAGYSYLSAPSLNLAMHGFNGDVAHNVRPWLSVGFDFSTLTGNSTLLPASLNSATQAKLATMLPPGVPVSAVAVPYSASICTYQGGTQLNLRKFRRVTFFARPGLGLLHAKLQTNPSISAMPIVRALMRSKLSAADNAVFYGFGGGISWDISPHFGVRTSVDFARYNFFTDVLNGPRNSVRISVTSRFGFGRNILRK